MTIDRNCLDAETVAAWMDGGLDAPGVAAAEAHASTCERCQALLATVVKTLPADQLEKSTVVSGFSRIDKHPTSLWKWWFAPLAATAAAVTIWVVVPQTPMQPPAATQIARDTADAPAKAQPPAPEFAPEAPAAATPPPPARDNSRRNVPAAANEAEAKLAAGADTGKLDASALGRKDAASAREQSADQLRDKQGKREENNARALEMRQAAESASAREQSGELRRDKPAAVPPAAAASGTTAERMREAPAAPSIGAVTQLRKQVSTPTVVSPDPNSRWRVSASGTIERSEDGGRTWIAVRIVANEEVLAGAAPGRLVCWLVGRNGLVLLATDGTNFTRLPFPESVDLVAVSSPEPRVATVTTADGRTFRTEDAGRNWRQ